MGGKCCILSFRVEEDHDGYLVRQRHQRRETGLAE